MRLIVDTCGGDNSPFAAIDGAVTFARKYRYITLILTGDKDAISQRLQWNNFADGNNIEIIHAPDVISCDDSPTAAIKQMPDSSMMAAIRLLSSGGADALISSGSTGALLAAGILKVKRIHGIIRPALTPLLPNLKDGNTLLIDSGANADCQPEYLVQFAIMGSLYMSALYGIDKPRVALISNGTEAEKGNEITRAAHALLVECSEINFVGNCEARDVLSGEFDVCVCDGFTGNIVLKSTEGAIRAFSFLLKEEIASGTVSKIGALLLRKKLRNLKKHLDYRERGGAPLLGISRCIIKAHGSSDSKAIFHALEQARSFVANNVNELISSAICKKD